MTDYAKKTKKMMDEAEADDMAIGESTMKSMLPKVSVTIEVGDDEPSGEYVCPDCGKPAVKK